MILLIDRNKIDRKIRIHFYSKGITLKTGTVVLNKILLDVLLNCCKMTDYYNLLYHILISNYFIIRLSATSAITIVLLPVPTSILLVYFLTQYSVSILLLTAQNKIKKNKEIDFKTNLYTNPF